MTVPDRDEIARLAGWKPPAGVVSAHVSIEPGDRSDKWRIRLDDLLRKLVHSASSNDEREQLEAVAERIHGRFPSDRTPSGRTHIGFVEVDGDGSSDFWTALQLPATDETWVRRFARPLVRPLVELLDEGAAYGVVLANAEQGRILEWALGELTDLDEDELGLRRDDWHERKARVPRPGALGTAVSSSGRDQHDQRMEEQRHHFADELAERTAKAAGGRGWRGLLAFGGTRLLSSLEEATNGSPTIVAAGDANLINEDRGVVLERINEAVRGHNRELERELVERAINSARASEGHGAIGIEPTRSALTQARVAHLVIDSDLDVREAERDPDSRLDPEVAEELIEAALDTGAEVTPVEGEAADLLLEHGRVAALLRY